MEQAAFFNPEGTMNPPESGGSLRPVPDTDGGARKPMDLPRLLRWIGGIVLVASACSFVLHSWITMDAMRRYLTFLGFTGVLAAAGLFCGLKLREDKGARTFFALAAAFLPAHFLQLGAFLYHRVVGTPPGIPEFFVLQTPSLSVLLITLAVALPLLSAFAFLGFSSLARVEAAGLTGAYLLANAALLIPTRNPDVIGLAALGLFLVLTGFVSRLSIRSAIMHTFDGAVARGMLFVPVFLLVVRNLTLYDLTSLLLSALATAAAIFSFSAARKVLKSDWSGRLAERTGFVLTAVAWYYFVDGLLFNPALGSIAAYLEANRNDAMLPLFALPFAGLMAGISITIPERGAEYRRFAAWFAILAMVYQLFTVPGLISSLICVLTGAGTLVLAFETEERGLFYSGAFGLGAGLLYHLKYATELYALSPWLTLAIPGVLLILASSYIERNGAVLLERVRRLKQEVDGWK